VPKPAEEYFIKKYGQDLHLYVEGQIYIMSPKSPRRVPEGETLLMLWAKRLVLSTRNRKDHDVSAMAFHSPKPIKLIIIAHDQKFWQHRVKLKLGPSFRRTWDSEIARMTNLLSGSQADA
jgi:hypothetical protein